MARPFTPGTFEAMRGLASALPHQKMTPEAAFRAAIRSVYPDIPEPPAPSLNAHDRFDGVSAPASCSGSGVES